MHKNAFVLTFLKTITLNNCSITVIGRTFVHNFERTLPNISSLITYFLGQCF